MEAKEKDPITLDPSTITDPIINEGGEIVDPKDPIDPEAPKADETDPIDPVDPAKEEKPEDPKPADPEVTEMPKVKSLSEMSAKELKAICDERGIKYKKVGASIKDLVALIEKNNNARVRDLNNKTISPVITENVKEEIPANFINLPKEQVNVVDSLKCHNGRFYKVLANGYGMYTDNGQTFNLNDIR